MSERYHYFSHIEDLASGSLYLADPFAPRQQQSLLCRYALHRQDASVLVPDPQKQGPAAWHRLLPVDRQQPLRDQPVLSLVDVESTFAARVASLRRIMPDPQLAFDVAFPMAQSAGYTKAHVNNSCGQLQAFISHPHNLGITCAESDASSDPSSADFGPWGNTFRLEGLKLIGLEIIHRYSGERPTLIVAGVELTCALLLASELWQPFYPGQIPFRLIMLQRKPHAGLCSRFEGLSEVPLEDSNGIAMDQHLADWVIGGLARHLGTAIALAQAEDSPFETALETLLRTGFVDDEDQVLLLGDASLA